MVERRVSRSSGEVEGREREELMIVARGSALFYSELMDKRSREIPLRAKFEKIGIQKLVLFTINCLLPLLCEQFETDS